MRALRADLRRFAHCSQATSRSPGKPEALVAGRNLRTPQGPLGTAHGAWFHAVHSRSGPFRPGRRRSPSGNGRRFGCCHGGRRLKSCGQGHDQAVRVYLDASALNRPCADQRGARNRLEAEVVLAVLECAEARTIELISSASRLRNPAESSYRAAGVRHNVPRSCDRLARPLRLSLDSAAARGLKVDA